MRKRTKAQTVFDRYDRILIDTSTLMNFEPLKLFLTGYEDRIRGSETQIVMPGSVQMELARHIGSGNHDKAEKSTACLSVLAEYPGLIACSSCDIPEELMYSTHADREILAMLTSGKGRYRQLLITNDSDLALDALALNSQLSCPGKTISVKKINRNGELRSFRAKNKPVSGTAATERPAPAAFEKDGELSARASFHGNEAVPVLEKLSAPQSASIRVAREEAAPAGVPVPVFVFGMSGTGVIGALLGAAAVKVSQGHGPFGSAA